MVDINECPVCKSRSLTPFRTCTDYTVSHETFPIHLCDNCKLGITTPRPELQDLGRYYQSEEYISHSGKSSGLMGPLYKYARSFALRWKTALIERYNTSGNALDFGCGTGEFLEALQRKGWTVDGVEPSDNARERAEQRINKTIHDNLSSVSTKQYDVITAWHVIEHVPDLDKTINQLKANLAKGGTIFIAVPNYESPDAQHYQNYWAGFDVPRHLWHFTRHSMKQLLTNHGFDLREIVPMKLDAFYVSMLSENYRTGTKSSASSMLRGALSGIRSNSAAGRDNYSSLIYIAKHT